MSKKEIARQIAIHMNRINSDVNIERTIKILIKGMTKNELEAALKGYNR